MLTILLSICLFVRFVKADDDWDDFTNNLATDLVGYECLDEFDWMLILRSRLL